MFLTSTREAASLFATEEDTQFAASVHTRFYITSARAGCACVRTRPR